MAKTYDDPKHLSDISNRKVLRGEIDLISIDASSEADVLRLIVCLCFSGQNLCEMFDSNLFSKLGFPGSSEDCKTKM